MIGQFLAYDSIVEPAYALCRRPPIAIISSSLFHPRPCSITNLRILRRRLQVATRAAAPRFHHDRASGERCVIAATATPSDFSLFRTYALSATTVSLTASSRLTQFPRIPFPHERRSSHHRSLSHLYALRTPPPSPIFHE